MTKDSQAALVASCRQGKPKVNLSAYNIFFLTERKRILSGVDETTSRASPFTKEEVLGAVLESKLRGKRSHRRSHGIISFKKLASTIGGRWKRLDPESERVVRNQAMIEKHIYEEQKELWKQCKQDTKKFESLNHTNQVGADSSGTAAAARFGAGTEDPRASQIRDLQALHNHVKKVIEKLVKGSSPLAPASENPEVPSAMDLEGPQSRHLSLREDDVGPSPPKSFDDGLPPTNGGASDDDHDDLLSSDNDDLWLSGMKDTTTMEPIDPQDLDSIFD